MRPFFTASREGFISTNSAIRSDFRASPTKTRSRRQNPLNIDSVFLFDPAEEGVNISSAPNRGVSANAAACRWLTAWPKILPEVKFPNPMRYGTAGTTETLQPMQHLVDSHGRNLGREGHNCWSWIALPRHVRFGFSLLVCCRIAAPKYLALYRLMIDDASAAEAKIWRQQHCHPAV